MASRLSLLMVATLALSAWADDLGPVQTLDRTAQQILGVVERERNNYGDDPQSLRSEVARLLAPRADFERIVRWVIGRYRGELTDAEIQRFAGVFAESMIDLYADALIALKAHSLEVEPLTSKGRHAQVRMRVMTTDDQTFNLTYSMGNASGSWKVLNILIDGMNLGMTYRNQFASLMKSHGGDIDTVINDWMQTAQDSVDLDGPA